MRNIGIIEYPIINEVSGLKFVLKKIIIIKLMASGVQAFAMPIQESPTKIKSLVLNWKYFRRTKIPSMNEIVTKIKLKVPWRMSNKVKSENLIMSQPNVIL